MQKKTDKEQLEEKRQEFSVEIRRKHRNKILDKKRDIQQEIQEEEKKDIQQQQNTNQQKLEQNQNKILQQNQQNGDDNNTFISNLQKDGNFMNQNGQFVPTEHQILQCIQEIQNKNNTVNLEEALQFISRSTMYKTCGKYARCIGIITTHNIAKDLFEIFFQVQQQSIKEIVLNIMVNIVQGTTKQTQHIIDYKYQEQQICGIDLFKNLLDEFMLSENLQGLKLIIFGIGNIIGTKQQYRDYFLKHGLFTKLVNINKKLNSQDTIQFEIMQNCAWTLCNLTREEAPAEYVFELEAVADMIKSFDQTKDCDFQCDIAWSINQVIKYHLKAEDGGPDNSHVIKYLLDSQILGVIQSCVFNVNMPIIQAGLKLFTSLMKGEINISVNVVQETKNTILPRILQLIDHTMRNIRTEALKIVTLLATLSDINVSDHISETFIQKVILRASKDDQTVQRECLKALKNILLNVSEKQVFLLTNQDLHEIVNKNLDMDNKSEMIDYALQIVKNMIMFYKNSYTLQLGGRYKKIRKIMEDNNIFMKVESLQDHPNERVYQLCVEVIQEYQSDSNDCQDDCNNYGLYSNGEGDQIQQE